jgi:hypothetical protein
MLAFTPAFLPFCRAPMPAVAAPALGEAGVEVLLTGRFMCDGPELLSDVTEASPLFKNLLVGLASYRRKRHGPKVLNVCAIN